MVAGQLCCLKYAIELQYVCSDVVLGYRTTCTMPVSDSDPQTSTNNTVCKDMHVQHLLAVSELSEIFENFVDSVAIFIDVLHAVHRHILQHLRWKNI